MGHIPPIDQRYRPQRSAYGPPPREEKTSSVLKLHMPLLTAIALCIFIAGATTVVVSQFYGLQNALTRIGDQLASFTTAFTKRVTQLETAIDESRQDRFTRTDHEIWCSRTEMLNPQWYCARQGNGFIRRRKSERLNVNENWQAKVAGDEQ